VTTILSILNRFKQFLLEVSLVNLELNGYQKSRRSLHMWVLCETLMSAKQAINDKLQGNVATHLRVVGLLITKLSKVYCGVCE